MKQEYGSDYKYLSKVENRKTESTKGDNTGQFPNTSEYTEGEVKDVLAE